MKIYFPHSKQLDYEEYYSQIRISSLFSEHVCIFPYENSSNPINSKSVIQTSDLIIAEVSYPATGLGIELGWANDFGKKIVFIYKEGSVITGSLKFISNNFISYRHTSELIEKLETCI